MLNEQCPKMYLISWETPEGGLTNVLLIGLFFGGQAKSWGHFEKLGL